MDERGALAPNDSTNLYATFTLWQHGRATGNDKV